VTSSRKNHEIETCLEPGARAEGVATSAFQHAVDYAGKPILM